MENAVLWWAGEGVGPGPRPPGPCLRGSSWPALPALPGVSEEGRTASSEDGCRRSGSAMEPLPAIVAIDVQ